MAAVRPERVDPEHGGERQGAVQVGVGFAGEAGLPLEGGTEAGRFDAQQHHLRHPGPVAPGALSLLAGGREVEKAAGAVGVRAAVETGGERRVSAFGITGMEGLLAAQFDRPLTQDIVILTEKCLPVVVIGELCIVRPPKRRTPHSCGSRAFKCGGRSSIWQSARFVSGKLRVRIPSSTPPLNQLGRSSGRPFLFEVSLYRKIVAKYLQRVNKKRN